MQKLLQGIHHFQTYVFDSHRTLFRRLAHGQAPSALFLTCSDSRVNPNLLTQTEPGDLFVIRNAGNIIPPAPGGGGEIASIEFAVVKLGIEDVIVCGHSDCGAMKGVLDPDIVGDDLPAMSSWLGHAARTADIIRESYTHLDEPRRLSATVGENVLVQIENLRTYDFIEERLRKGTLRLHGWVYKFETGQVFSFDASSGQFLPLELGRTPSPVYPRGEVAVAAPREEAP